jgi:hypothetical protein
MVILACAFVPLTVVPDTERFGLVPAVGALLVSAGMLAVGSAAVFPFEMDTVVSLAGGKLVATHYGFYNTIVGVGILVGNLATGSVLSAVRRIGFSEILWAALILVGVIAALVIDCLDRAGRLRPPKGALEDVGVRSGRSRG